MTGALRGGAVGLAAGLPAPPPSRGEPSLPPAVRLERLGFEHAAALQALLSSAAVAGPLGLRRPLRPDHAVGDVAALRHFEREGTRVGFAVVVTGAGGAAVIAGGCDLCAIDRLIGEATLRFWLGEPFWGRGIGRAAVGALLDEARVRSLRTLRAVIAADNTRSRRLVEALGFAVGGDGLQRPATEGSAPILVYLRAV
ncbi:GNAT family N-acetyltransferase [Sorangium sp. So ce726]|uniref:GNAT family N-acetyltransferase n=1 Tax=Sorangium sp. So ce726 TaxID=3133319 RepID=UPI003F621E7E